MRGVSHPLHTCVHAHTHRGALTYGVSHPLHTCTHSHMHKHTRARAHMMLLPPEGQRAGPGSSYVLRTLWFSWHFIL